MSTRAYRNTSDKSLNVLGVGEIPAGGQVSVSGAYLPTVILENYPGLEDITDLDESEGQE